MSPSVWAGKRCTYGNAPEALIHVANRTSATLVPALNTAIRTTTNYPTMKVASGHKTIRVAKASRMILQTAGFAKY